MIDTRKIIAELRQIRRSKKISQAELAEITGYNRVTICLMEIGKRRLFSVHMVADIATALGYTIELKLVEVPVPPPLEKQDEV